jgi:hypothetical protein
LDKLYNIIAITHVYTDIQFHRIKIM